MRLSLTAIIGGVIAERKQDKHAPIFLPLIN